MTLRQLKEQIEKSLANLEKDYGRGADIDIVVYNEEMDCLLNGINLTVGMIDYSQYSKNIKSFPYPLDGRGMLAILTYGN